jgi:hypothetical protein
MLHRVVWWKFTDVSELLTVSIIRAMSALSVIVLIKIKIASGINEVP